MQRGSWKMVFYFLGKRANHWAIRLTNGRPTSPPPCGFSAADRFGTYKEINTPSRIIGS